MKKVSKIVSTIMAAVITASMCTNYAHAYRLTAHNAMDNGSSIVEGYILNAGDLYSAAATGGTADVIGYALNIYNAANGDIDSVAESICIDITNDSLFGRNSNIFKTAKLAIDAYSDYFEACHNLGAAKDAEYKASINTYYTINVNSCFRLIQAVKSSTIEHGNKISQSTLDGCQRLVNNMTNDVAKLRSKSFNRRFRTHKKENVNYADSLENLINAINFDDIYKKCVQYRNDNYYAHFQCISENSYPAAAVTSMLLAEKGQVVPQQTVAAVAGSAFWNGVEPYFNLNDGGSFTVLTGDGENKLCMIKNSFRNTSAVVKFGNLNEYTYIVAVSRGNDIKFVDTDGTGVMLSPDEFAANKSYSVNEFYSRLLACWSYM